jgi:hypothetical protein
MRRLLIRVNLRRIRGNSTHHIVVHVCYTCVWKPIGEAWYSYRLELKTHGVSATLQPRFLPTLCACGTDTHGRLLANDFEQGGDASVVCTGAR